MKTIIIILFINVFSIAQEEDPLKYFPYKTGNMWEYFYVESGYPDTVQCFNIQDSVDADGNIYFTQYARKINPFEYPLLFLDTASYMIDTSFNVFGPGPISKNDLIYKLKAKQGDQWVLYDYSEIGGSGYEIIRVNEVWEDELFLGSEIFTTFKAYSHFYTSDSIDTLGLDRTGKVLAYNFGLWSRGGGDASGDIVLKGCVINDTLYGDTTNIITSVKDLSGYLPIQFELHQNYPNPFNPFTTISFNLKNSANISLIVYDLMGREIKKLINNEWTIYGNHRMIWDGKSDSGQISSSGVYYYSLISNGIRITRSMILLK